jgi:ribosomal protein S18 acetylase RimI-like enzyme
VEPSGLDASPGADAARAFEAPEVGDGTRDFEDETQERIYAYVARHGGASADAVRDALGLGVERFTYHLEALRQQGYVEERDDGLHLSRTVAATERAPGTPTVVVRPATQSDLAGLVAVMREVTDERTHVVAESVAEQVAYEETVRRHTSAAARTFLVASVGDRESDGDGDGDGDAAGRRADEAARDGIVGWAHLTMPEVEKLAHTAELTVGVLDAYRRMGVGGALLERALERAAADGRHRVYQSLPATNRAAIGFLDAHGWRVEAVRENHYRIGGAFVDEVMMAIEL